MQIKEEKKGKERKDDLSKVKITFFFRTVVCIILATLKMYYV